MCVCSHPPLLLHVRIVTRCAFACSLQSVNSYARYVGPGVDTPLSPTSRAERESNAHSLLALAISSPPMYEEQSYMSNGASMEDDEHAEAALLYESEPFTSSSPGSFRIVEEEDYMMQQQYQQAVMAPPPPMVPAPRSRGRPVGSGKKPGRVPGVPVERAMVQGQLMVYLRDTVWNGEVTDRVRMRAFLEAFHFKPIRFRWPLGMLAEQLQWPTPSELFVCINNRLAANDLAEMTLHEQELYVCFHSALQSADAKPPTPSVARVAPRSEAVVRAAPTPVASTRPLKKQKSPVSFNPKYSTADFITQRPASQVTIIPPDVDVPPIPYDPAAPTLGEFLESEVWTASSRVEGRLVVLAAALTGAPRCCCFWLLSWCHTSKSACRVPAGDPWYVRLRPWVNPYSLKWPPAEELFSLQERYLRRAELPRLTPSEKQQYLALVARAGEFVAENGGVATVSRLGKAKVSMSLGAGAVRHTAAVCAYACARPPGRVVLLSCR